MAEATEFPARMSDSDALMWTIEKDPLLRSTITSVMLLDRAPDPDVLRRRVDDATWTVPRLRQRVRSHPYSIAPPRWEADPNFDLAFHLRWTRAREAGGLRQVFDIAEPVAMQGFDRARPLWEFVVVEGLEDGKAAVIQKIHHAITDGVGGVKLQLELLDLDRDATERSTAPITVDPDSEQLSEVERSMNALRWQVSRSTQAARHLTEAAAATAREAAVDPVGVITGGLRLAISVTRLLAPTTAPLSPLMRDRSLSVHFDTLDLGLDDTKKSARVVGGKLNDAFVAGIAGGLRRYHEHHGHPVDELRMTMPINTRRAGTENRAGNQFVPARFPIPVGITDPVALLTEIRERVEAEKGEPALALTEPLASALNRLPATASTAVFGGMLRGVDFVTTNVPGPPMRLYVAGAELLGQYAFAPMIGAAANFALLSYVDRLNIGINTDPAAIPDPEVLKGCIAESFAELHALS